MLEIIEWLWPILMTGLMGYYAGYCHERRNQAMTAARAVLFVLLKLQKRGVFLSSYDISIINAVVKIVR